MASKMRETEWKYDLPPGATVPDLAGLPQVATVSEPRKQVLRAVYHDTEDLRLMRAGITLRRRTGGTDAGWHLKLPDGEGARIELRLPLGRGGLPAELSGLVRAWTRGLPLKPVARITTNRRAQLLHDEGGVTLAEVVVDDVIAESLGATATLSRWDEVEVELVEGDESLLKAADKRLRHGGLVRSTRTAKLEFALADRLPEQSGEPAPELSPTSSAANVVLAYFTDQIKGLISLDPSVRRAEPDAVHQMRVAARRLRSALRSFRSLLAPDAIRSLGEELRWLGEVLGAERDEEVLCERLLADVARLPPELVVGPVQARIVGHFAPRQAAARTGVLKALDSDRYLALLDGLDALLTAEHLPPKAGKAAAKVLPPMVDKAIARVNERMDRAFGLPGGTDRDLAMHEARKAAKRARYAAEAVEPALGKGMRKPAKAMKGLQTVLGDHQDAVLAGVVIRELGMSAYAGGENAFTYGVLYERNAAARPVLQAQAEHDFAG